ncbi:MAG: GGDEF domain-containing protein [Pseudomonadota bacterium]
MDGLSTKQIHTDNQRKLRAAGLFVSIVVVAIALSALFATILGKTVGIPRDQLSFLLTALQISLCVVVPLAAFAAQNDYRLGKYRDQLERFASTDALTGLLNRRFFNHRLGEELRRMERSGETAAIILFDIDHFKSINDEHGHKAGDVVLKTVALAVQSELRGPMDRLARWGGEEFIVLLTGLSLTQAKSVAERLRKRVEETVVYQGQSKIMCTASFGVATLLAGDAQQDTIDSADVALYQAKHLGRNRTVTAPERAGALFPANDRSIHDKVRRA